MQRPLETLIQTYHELNASVIDELDEEPSPLEFMRYVAKNRPFVVRGAAANWKAVERWNIEYLGQVMGDAKVKVAMTPHGNADAVVEQEDGTLIFVEPHEIFEPFTTFLEDLRQQPTAGQSVKYAQTQNDNLRAEYSSLSPDVPEDVPFARIALFSSADAVNLWLGNDRSVTSLHKDNYENVYVQVIGQKHFTLLPAVEIPCANERLLSRGRYVPSPTNDETETLVVQPDPAAEKIPVPTWDPDDPSARPSPYSHLSQPLRVTLREGDMLYLPALWYHKVSQTAGEEGFVAAVNYWYDMDFSGSFWASNAFVRDVVKEEGMRPQYPRLHQGEEEEEEGVRKG